MQSKICKAYNAAPKSGILVQRCVIRKFGTIFLSEKASSQLVSSCFHNVTTKMSRSQLHKHPMIPLYCHQASENISCWLWPKSDASSKVQQGISYSRLTPSSFLELFSHLTLELSWKPSTILKFWTRFLGIFRLF